MRKFFYFFAISAIVLGMASCGDGNEPEQMVSGKFTVGEGKQVYFAQSNLLLDKETNKWSFAASPWEITGKNPNTIYREHFTWNEIDQSSDFNDWSINTIENGDGHTWRVLRTEEWYYLFHERNNADKLFAHARVYGVNGLIILPDDWDIEHETELALNSMEWLFIGSAYEYYDKSLTNHYAENKISDGWDALQKKGAVFLPAAGDYDGGTLRKVGQNGYYWASTKFSETASYYVILLDNQLTPSYQYSGDLRKSLRLVRDVK